MPLLKSYRKIPKDFKLLVYGYQKRVTQQHIPLPITSLITLFLVCVETEKMFNDEFYLWENYKVPLSWMKTIFCITNIYWKIRFKVSNFIIDVYPKLSKYNVNSQQRLQNILTVNGKQWNSYAITNSKYIKFMIQLRRNTTCQCSGLIKIFILNKCNNNINPLRSSQCIKSETKKRKFFRCYDSDACIAIPLEDDNFFVSDAAVTITYYDGNELHVNHKFKMFGISQGCHCCEASNESCQCIQF